jgi:20S proteasome subunit alpha 7
MSATGAGYDLSVTTFSPDGRVFQVEYASKAVEKSGTAIGVRCVDGVVLGVEKLILSKMLVEGSNRRIHNVDMHAGIALAGLAADAKQIVNRARSEARSYREFYGTPIGGKVLNDRLSGFVHLYTLYWYLRPFGASVLLACYDTEGPQLYMIEPSGVSYRYLASSIGKNTNGARTELEKIKFNQITCRQAVNEVAKIIYKLHDDVKDKDFELELSWVCDESLKKHQMVPKAVRDEAVRLAKEAKDKAEMDDSDDDDEEKGKGKSEDTSKTKDTKTTAAGSAKDGPTTQSKPAGAGAAPAPKSGEKKP